MGLEPICVAAAAASCKSNAAAATQYEYFHLIAAKKPLLNGPAYKPCNAAEIYSSKLPAFFYNIRKCKLQQLHKYSITLLLLKGHTKSQVLLVP